MTLTDALKQAATAGLDRLDAQMLLLHAMGRSPHDRAWLLTHDSDTLPNGVAARWQTLRHRRQAGEPVAYLLGEKAFFGLNLAVDPRVLVPRPDTETLVQWMLDTLTRPQAPAGKARGQSRVTGPSVLDLGTGSGAVALAVKSQRPDCEVSATDTSADALAVAKANAKRLELAVNFFAGDWFQAVSGQRFEVIGSNPPYIAEGDPHLPALQHEPGLALTAGPDGLDDIRSIIDQAPPALAPGGWLLLEHGHDQASAVRALLTKRGFHAISSRRDLAGIERCSGGQWPQQR